MNHRRSAIHSTHDAHQKYCLWSSQTIPPIGHTFCHSITAYSSHAEGER
jgi:hypothetical protein